MSIRRPRHALPMTLSMQSASATYPGLGRTLEPAPAATGDTFLPMAPQPLDDLADWLDGLCPMR